MPQNETKTVETAFATRKKMMLLPCVIVPLNTRCVNPLELVIFNIPKASVVNDISLSDMCIQFLLLSTAMSNNTI